MSCLTKVSRHQVIREDIENIFLNDLEWERFNNSHILIAGAASFLAAYLIDFFSVLSEKKPENPVVIYALARSMDKLRERFPYLIGRKWFRPVIQDVCEPLPEINKLDFIIHAASPGSPKQYLADPVGTIRANVQGSFHLLELAKLHQAKLLFMSTGAVYGESAGLGAVSETAFGGLDPLGVAACYAESKRMAETLCANYYRQYGVDSVIARISHTYGPGFSLDDGRSFAEFIACAVAGKDIYLKNEGSSRPFCYIADTVLGFLILLLRGEPGEAYNVGYDQELTILQLAQLIARLTSGKNISVRLPSLTEASRSLFSESGHFDISKMKSLGWQPSVTPEEGFLRTLKYYID